MNLKKIMFSCFALAASCLLAVVRLDADNTSRTEPGTKTQVVFGHSMEGSLASHLAGLVDEFNRQSTKAEVILRYRGPLEKSFEDVKANRQNVGALPEVLMVSENNTIELQKMPELYEPLENFLSTFDRKIDLLPLVKQFYTIQGRLLALPFTGTVPLVYFNRSMLRQAGVDKLPQTWKELEDVLGKLYSKNLPGLTFPEVAAYCLENLSYVNNIPLADLRNGDENPAGAELRLDDPAFVTHLRRLQDWARKNWFTWSGDKAGTAEEKFARGEVAILMQSAEQTDTIQRLVAGRFEIGYAPYPYDNDLGKDTEKVVDKMMHRPPYAVINFGGSCLWLMHSRNWQEAVEFFQWLMSDAAQGKWHKETGFIPVTMTAEAKVRMSGFYRQHPGMEAAVQQTMRKPGGRLSGFHVADYATKRARIVTMLEEILRPPYRLVNDAIRDCKAEVNRNIGSHR